MIHEPVLFHVLPSITHSYIEYSSVPLYLSFLNLFYLLRNLLHLSYESQYGIRELIEISAAVPSPVYPSLRILEAPQYGHLTPSATLAPSLLKLTLSIRQKILLYYTWFNHTFILVILPILYDEMWG